ncbi:MAG: Do family serine endopeptidase [Nitrospirae bacterium]|nr:Do family serine endopeptidase [Nitrospirota bacterium]
MNGGEVSFRRSGSTLILCIFFLLSIVQLSATDMLLAADEKSGINLLEEMEKVFVQLSDRVKPSVVNISPSPSFVPPPQGPDEGQGEKPPELPGSGSGVIVDKRGYILTNNHVVGEAAEVEVRLSDKSRFIGKVVGKDPDTDLAVVKVDTDHELPFVPIGDSSKLKVGQWAIAVGNPFGLDRTVTIGVVSAMGRENINLSRYEDFIQTDASINPGNSGGPLFNIHGEVIGINTAIINFAQGIGFAIPSNMARDIMAQLVEKGRVVRGWLGIGIQQLTPELASKFGVKETEGVLVSEVFDGHPAQKAGIIPGDIISGVEGKQVDTPAALARAIAGMMPGKKVGIEIIRDGKRRSLVVEITERKEEAVTAAIPKKQPEIALGINVEDLTQDLVERFNIKEKKGVLITDVEPNSPAEREGIRPGDLLKEVNKVEVNTVTEFNAVINKLKKDESILLRIIRENRAFFIVLNLGKP